MIHSARATGLPRRILLPCRSFRHRRAVMVPASDGGNRVPVIARLVQADEDTVRDVIHRFNEIGRPVAAAA
ncbi:helix-turn-helix domain-containing protein [Microtetraspora malaysiensis]|uniref:helix-turn-helix domain-containing protein n=1 Tax=Microtetraspora malaysiensis TaxID=161358 RepID=UPI001C3F3400|nr:helix-turn-helix domain-containing protein [Microtetraspora malaysiensis]